MTTLFADTSFTKNQKHFAPNRTSYLVFQDDGNLVLYRNNGKPVWATGTDHRGNRAVFQADGNLVVYHDNSPLWASNTDRHPTAVLTLQSDGNLVIYENGRPLWASNTNDGWCSGVRDITGKIFDPDTPFQQGKKHFAHNRTSYLVFQHDGNLVLYRNNGKPVWATGTDHRGNRAVFQADGNLVVYHDNNPLWSSNTYGFPHAALTLQSDGNLVIYENGNPKWASNTNDGFCQSVADVHHMVTAFDPHHTFHHDLKHWSKNRTSYLVFQSDGNLVLYRANNSPVWATGTDRRGKRAVFQEDGNLVIYDDFSALWASNTHGHPDSQLVLQSDGNLVIYENNRPLWASNTNDERCRNVPDLR